MRLKKFMLLAMLCFMLAAIPSNGQIGEKLYIHGFGGWAYGQTDGNRYQIGNDSGEFRNSQFSLNLTALPLEKLTLNAQLHMETQLLKEKAELDYAFFEWAFSDAFKVRMGQVKCPIGIYSELYDVGTSRPFYSLPESVYGKKGIVNKSYFGIGITGNLFAKNGWGVAYDLYGGEMDLQEWTLQHVVQIPFMPYQMELFLNFTGYYEDMIGTRIVVYTPIQGLSLGFSGTTGKPNVFFNGEEDQNFFTPGTYNTVVFHVEYTKEPFSVRTEYLNLSRAGEKALVQDSFYLEAAYRFLNKWQIAFLYDRVDYEHPLQPIDQSQYEHREYAVGLNYWVNPDFVLKTAFHKINGNYFAFPESLLEAIRSGGLEHNTNFFTAGMQFSF